MHLPPLLSSHWAILQFKFSYVDVSIGDFDPENTSSSSFEGKFDAFFFLSFNRYILASQFRMVSYIY